MLHLASADACVPAIYVSYMLTAFVDAVTLMLQLAISEGV